MKMEQITCTRRFVVAAVLICAIVSRAAAQECPAECQCTKGTMNCEELPQLPDILPEGVTELVCTRCDLQLQISNGYMFPDSYAALAKLLLGESMLASLPTDVFLKLSNLRVLDLSGNSLGELRKEMFNGLSNLDKLVLEGSKVTNFSDGFFSNFPNLQYLDLSDNKITISENLFAGLTNLQVLCLKRCSLTTVPVDALNSVSNTLVRLDLDHNHGLFELVDDGFSSLRNLQKLSLNECNIESISEKTFSGLAMLETLFLGNNQLQQIPAKSLEASKSTLKQLWLEKNQLTSLPSDLLDWSIVKSVRFELNSWMCDCGIGWINKVDLPHLDPGNVTCSSPAELLGHLVTDATSDQDCPCPSCGGGGYNNSVAIGIAIPIIIIAVLLIGYYVYKICVKRGQKAKKDVRYSSVYKPTTEAAARQNTKEPLV